jgi:zinc transport system ATP-binding protein
MKNKPLVKLENAGVYKDTRWLVRGISLKVYKNNIVTLIGPNGSGKTTTGKLILKFP